LVSTDQEGIADIARHAGATVPWLRPEYLSSDTASSVDVSLHALDWYESQHGTVDGLLLLQPTTPFRRPEQLMRGLQLHASHARRAVIGVAPAASHPMWCFKLAGDSLQPFIEGTSHLQRSQDLPAAYVLSGAFYLIQPNQLRSQRTFCPEDVVPLVVDDPLASIDIDSEWDWRVAESMLSLFRASGSAR
jgi:CMP-N-acetylneuraminic acid synthetase